MPPTRHIPHPSHRVPSAWALRPLLAAALLAASAADAQPRPPPATHADDAAGRAAFDRGLQALRAGRHAEAELALRDALRLRPTPITVYNLALALRALGRYGESIECFERYLQQPEPAASPERLAAIRAELTELQRMVPRVELTVQPPDAAVRVDGRAAQRDAAGLRLDPGEHTFEVEAEGFERDRRVLTLAPGAQVILALSLRPTPAEATLVVEPSLPSARVSVDGASVGNGRVERTLQPGEHVVEVSAAGHDLWRRAVTLRPRGALRLDVALTPTRAVSRTPAWVLPVAIVGGAALVAGVVAGVAVGTRGVDEPIRGTWGTFTAR